MDTLFPPGPQKSLFLGNAPDFERDALGFMERSARQHGELVHFRYGPMHAYLVTNPSEARYVLEEAPHLFTKQMTLRRALNSAMGHELIPPKAPKKKFEDERALFRPAWLSELLAPAVSELMAQAESWPYLRPFDLFAALKRQSLTLATRVMFNQPADELWVGLSERAQEGELFADRGMWLPNNKTLARTFNPKRSSAAVERLDAEIKRLTSSGGTENSLLARLVQTGTWRDGSSLAAVRDEALVLFNALYQLGAQAAYYTLYLLSRQTDSALRVQDEMTQVLGEKSPTLADISELQFLEQSVMESLRLYPPAWMVVRQAKMETQVGSYYVPAGSTLYISPYIIHRSSRYFMHPDRFMPDRFNPSLLRQGANRAFMPFAGSRGVALEHPVVTTVGRVLAASALRAGWVTFNNPDRIFETQGSLLRPVEGVTATLSPRPVTLRSMA